MNRGKVLGFVEAKPLKISQTATQVNRVNATNNESRDMGGASRLLHHLRRTHAG
jgi:hypothetical protein